MYNTIGECVKMTYQMGKTSVYRKHVFETLYNLQFPKLTDEQIAARCINIVRHHRLLNWQN